MHGMLLEDVRPDDLFQFLSGRLAMESGCDQDRNLAGRDTACLQSADHVRQHGLVWRWPSDVTNGDRRTPFASSEFLKARAADRARDGRGQCRILVCQAACEPRPQDLRVKLVGDIDCSSFAVKRELYFHRECSSAVLSRV